MSRHATLQHPPCPAPAYTDGPPRSPRACSVSRGRAAGGPSSCKAWSARPQSLPVLNARRRSWPAGAVVHRAPRLSLSRPWLACRPEVTTLEPPRQRFGSPRMRFPPRAAKKSSYQKKEQRRRATEEGLPHDSQSVRSDCSSCLCARGSGALLLAVSSA
jgi:hypothetical protein